LKALKASIFQVGNGLTHYANVFGLLYGALAGDPPTGGVIVDGVTKGIA
jgi:hypothetical protein